MLSLANECPIAPRDKPEGYRVEPAKTESKTCDLCRDGWLRIVGIRSGRALHSLPEPAPMFACSHVDEALGNIGGRSLIIDVPPTIHACHHVEPCAITQWCVGIAFALAIAATIAWPHIGGLLR